jgi:cholestenol delta-isomerase
LFFGTLFVITAIFVSPLVKRKDISSTDKVVFVWFLCSGCIHTFFEGYFGLFHATIPEDTSVLGDMWKEYAKSDSRYVTSDSFVVSMERLTAVSF